jgi:ABC-type bacteriocin/lantibiotic exporter with double-glycine peptidase domain
MLRFLIKNLGPFKFRFWVIFTISLINSAAIFAVPFVLSEKFSGEVSKSSSNSAIIIVSVIFILSIILEWFIRRWGESLRYSYSNYIKLKFFESLEGMSLDPNKNQVHTGYLLSLISKVSDSVFSTLSLFCWAIPGTITTTVIFLYLIISQSILIALVNIAVISIFMFTSIALSRRLSVKFKDLNESQAELNEQLIDFMNNSGTLKLLHAFKFSRDKLENKASKVNSKAQDLQNLHSNRWALLHLIYGFSFLSTLYILVSKISTGDLPVATMIIFIPTFSYVKSNLESTSETIMNFIEAGAYLKTLNGTLNIDSSTGVETTSKPISWHTLGFKNLAYKYNNTNKKVRFQDFTINRGDKVMISGKSGRGKSTLINILAGYLEPSSGEVLLDGKGIQSDNSIFQNISLVTQDTELFNLSLEDNLCLGKTIEKSRLIQLLNDAGLGDILKNHPLSGISGEKGNKFSVGQKQRINILRTLISDKEIVILDEPTSNLDTKTEQKVINLIEKELKDKTTIIVSHRKEISKICNKYYTL